MWSYLTTRSFISPLPGYVENKAGDAEDGLGSTKSPFCSCVSITLPGLARVEHLCESVADARDSRRDKGDSALSRHWLVCLNAGDASEAFLRIAAPNRLL